MNHPVEWTDLILRCLVSFATTTLESFAFYAGIYLIMAAAAYLVLWKWGKERWAHKRVQKKPRHAPRVAREIGYSMLTLFTFSAMLGLLFELPRFGITELYFSISDHGWAWFLFSIALMAVVHDTYYYWAHRLMHTRWLFRRVHMMHHQFTNPSPFAAYAFHPLEILVEIAIFGVMAFLFPLHPFAIAAYVFILTYLNVISHLGYELYTSRVHNWFITSTHHNMHHTRANGNFMLYFNIWDKLMGTNHADYPALYEELAHARPQHESGGSKDLSSAASFK